VVLINSYYFSVGCWTLRDNILDLAKKVLPPLESKLLVLCESTGNTLKIVYNVL
jgi:hypothetical protein